MSLEIPESELLRRAQTKTKAGGSTIIKPLQQVSGSSDNRRKKDRLKQECVKIVSDRKVLVTPIETTTSLAPVFGGKMIPEAMPRGPDHSLRAGVTVGYLDVCKTPAPPPARPIPTPFALSDEQSDQGMKVLLPAKEIVKSALTEIPGSEPGFYGIPSGVMPNPIHGSDKVRVERRGLVFEPKKVPGKTWLGRYLSKLQ